MKTMMCSMLAGAAALSMAGSAGAAISIYTGQVIGTPTAFTDLNGFGGGVQTYDDGGVHMAYSTGANIYNYGFLYPCGGDFTNVMYNCNGGGRTQFSKTDGSDIGAIEMQTGNGWGFTTNYLWITAYDNGSPVAEFNLDINCADYWGVSGPGFDELRVGKYFTQSDRDQHDENSYTSCTMMDNIKMGAVPAPGAAALLGVGGLVAARRRRA